MEVTTQAREGIDTLTRIIRFSFPNVTTQAREGIDTCFLDKLRLISIVTTQAREGIDTYFGDVRRFNWFNVEMRYQPERALTQPPILRYVSCYQ